MMRGASHASVQSRGRPSSAKPESCLPGDPPQALLRPSAAQLPALPANAPPLSPTPRPPQQKRAARGPRRLVRDTLYPALRDHPSVSAHPPVKGLARRLFFLDHRNPETGADEGRSKSNLWEADFAVGLARWGAGGHAGCSSSCSLRPSFGCSGHCDW